MNTAFADPIEDALTRRLTASEGQAVQEWLDESFVLHVSLTYLYDHTPYEVADVVQVVTPLEVARAAGRVV
jgi:hypothetical protein